MGLLLGHISRRFGPPVILPRGHNSLASRVIPLTSRDDYAAALELIQAGKMHVREMTTHRLGPRETGHFSLPLRGAAGDAAIPPGLGLSKSDYRAAEVDIDLLLYCDQAFSQRQASLFVFRGLCSHWSERSELLGGSNNVEISILQ
jgi:hypothetical protein